MQRYLRIIAIIIVVFALSVMMAEFSFFQVLSLRIFDSVVSTDYILKQKLHQPVYDDITIIDIDEYSIARLGQYRSWPNLYFVDLVNILSSEQAKLIAFDILFAESDSLSSHVKDRLLQEAGGKINNTEEFFALLSSDQKFAEAIENAGNVFLAMFNSPDSTASGYLPSTLSHYDVKPEYSVTLDYPHPPIPILAESAYGVGFIYFIQDLSGIVHSFPLFLKHKSRYMVNFSFQACIDLMQIDSLHVDNRAKLYSGGELVRNLPLSPDGKFFLRYYGMGHSFRYVSFYDVLLGRVAPGYFKDKIVLVGSSATGLRDIKPTPLDPAYPGVELHATFMRNLIEEDYVKWLNPYLSYLIVLLLLVFTANFIYRARPQMAVLVFVALSVAMFIGFYAMYYHHGTTLEYTKVLLPWLLCNFAIMYEHYDHQIREKKQVRNAFEHYVSKDVISQIMTDRSMLKLGGEKKPVTVFFADIRNFSTYCETCITTDITNFLYAYFNRTTKVITNNKGLLDKYIGDASVAIFNVPIAYPDYQYLACKSALEVLEQARNLRKEYAQHPILKDFAIGIGIGSGELIIGNMGSDEIFNYTGIGDTMNLSSRLESLNKFYKSSIIIEENTYQAVSDRLVCRYLDCVSVKGKSKSNKIYELIGFKENIYPGSPILSTIEHYETGLLVLQGSKFEEAEQHFKQALSYKPDDYPSMLMMMRIETVDRDKWDGIWRHDSK